MAMEHVDCTECLIRVTHSPEHYKNGVFKNTAVSLDDLRERGLSVDREHITPLHVMAERVARQQEKRPDERETPVYSRLICGQLRAEVDGSGGACFRVEAEPVLDDDLLPDNPGHAGIYACNPKPDSHLRAIRVRLIAHLNNIVEERDLCFPATPPTA